MMAGMRAPEDFVELCMAMYGPAVDADVVWSDVAKRGPADADTAATQQRRTSPVKRTAEGLALASTVAGGILGVKEGARSFKLIRTARAAGQKVPGEAKRGLALAGLATGGDAITTGVLAAGSKKDQKVQKTLRPTGRVVSKRDFGSIRPAVAGLKRAWNPDVTAAVKPPKVSIPKSKVPASGVDLGAQMKTNAVRPTTRAEVKAQRATTAATASTQRNVAAGQDIATAMNTTTGKVAVGGAAGIAGVGLIGRSRRKRASQMEYVPDPYGVGKRYEDVTFEGTFSKVDTDKRLVFGWASVTSLNGVPVVDRQGDYIDSDDLEEAAYAYVHKSRVGGDMHQRSAEIWTDSPHKVSDMVESMVFTDEKCREMNLPDDFPRGWWVGYKIHDDHTWDLVKKGERTGFSIHGRGLRKAIDEDELMYAGVR